MPVGDEVGVRALVVFAVRQNVAGLRHHLNIDILDNSNGCAEGQATPEWCGYLCWACLVAAGAGIVQRTVRLEAADDEGDGGGEADEHDGDADRHRYLEQYSHISSDVRCCPGLGDSHPASIQLK